MLKLMDSIDNPSDPSLLVVGINLGNGDGLEERLDMRVRDVVWNFADHNLDDQIRAVIRVDVRFLSIAPLQILLGLKTGQGVGLWSVGNIVGEAVTAR